MGVGEIVDIFSYCGPFVEDGSDESINNVIAVAVKNTTNSDIKYFQFEIKTADGSFCFSASTLPAGKCLTVLEENQKNMPNDLNVVSAVVNAVEFFPDLFSLHEDIFEFTTADGMLTIKNVSKSIAKRAIVYYKQLAPEGFFGGITYKVSVGTLNVGKIKEIPVSHFANSNYSVVFITYDNQVV